MSSDRGWAKKFSFALAGIAYSVRHQNSFWVHVPVTIAIVAAGLWLRIEAWRWSAVMMAITVVCAAELLNTSLEQLVQALHPEHDKRIGIALDAAAGAVLVAAIGAVAIGLIALGTPLWNAVMALV